MADGKLIKDLSVISKASDDCDLIIEDDSPKTMRIKLGDLKDYINQEIQTQIQSINNDLSNLQNSTLIGNLARISTSGTLITSDDDLDTFIGSDYAGLYRFSSGSLPTNRPSDYTSMNGYLEVLFFGSSVNTTAQYIYRFSSGISNSWRRRYYNGAWSDWVATW